MSYSITKEEAVVLIDVLDRNKDKQGYQMQEDENGICLANLMTSLSDRLYNIIEDYFAAEGYGADKRAELESYFHGQDVSAAAKLKCLATPGHPQIDPGIAC